MLALLMFPLGAMVYMVVFVILMESFWSWSKAELAFICTAAATWLFIASYWIALWRKSVRWTGWRVIATGVAAVAVLLPALIGGVAIGVADDDLGAFIGGIIAILLWLTCTVFIWRDTRSERAARFAGSGQAVVCPGCGYNLTGLRQTTCPECGAAFTLNELLAGQSGQESLE